MVYDEDDKYAAELKALLDKGYVQVADRSWRGDRDERIECSNDFDSGNWNEVHNEYYTGDVFTCAINIMSDFGIDYDIINEPWDGGYTECLYIKPEDKSRLEQCFAEVYAEDDHEHS